jgi:hypothetical protein
MKTLSEYTNATGDATAVVLWYPKEKKWITRCFMQMKKVDEKLFTTESAAEEFAEDYVLMHDLSDRHDEEISGSSDLE